MISVTRFRLGRSSVAILSVTVALLISLLLRPVFGTFAALFIAAVALNIWYGGLWAGLLNPGLSFVASRYFLLQFQQASDFPTSFSLIEFFFVGLFFNAFFAPLP